MSISVSYQFVPLDIPLQIISIFIFAAHLCSQTDFIMILNGWLSHLKSHSIDWIGKPNPACIAPSPKISQFVWLWQHTLYLPEDKWWPHMLRVSATMGPFSRRSSSSVVLLMNKDGMVFTSSRCGLPPEKFISPLDAGKAYLYSVSIKMSSPSRL